MSGKETVVGGSWIDCFHGLIGILSSVAKAQMQKRGVLDSKVWM